MDIRKEAISRSQAWWFCENIVNHHGQVGLLRMDFPRVFILIRDYDDCYAADFNEFKNNIAEVNFFDPPEREGTDVESILIDAWNFLSLVEEKEDQLAEEYDDFDEF